MARDTHGVASGDISLDNMGSNNGVAPVGAVDNNADEVDGNADEVDGNADEVDDNVDDRENQVESDRYTSDATAGIVANSESIKPIGVDGANADVASFDAAPSSSVKEKKKVKVKEVLVSTEYIPLYSDEPRTVERNGDLKNIPLIIYIEYRIWHVDAWLSDFRKALVILSALVLSGVVVVGFYLYYELGNTSAAMLKCPQ
jgi:hypothetical protein